MGSGIGFARWNLTTAVRLSDGEGLMWTPSDESIEEPRASFSHALEAFVMGIERGQKAFIFEGVRGGLRDILFLHLQEKVGRPFVLITPTESGAELLAERVRGLLPQSHGSKDVDYYPLTDVSPYQSLPANRLFAVERIRILHRLLGDSPPKFLVASAPALDVYTIPRVDFKGASFRLYVGQELERADVEKHLVTAGYSRVPSVRDPGTFSVRGGIVDVYSTGDGGAVRVDFFGDEIESIRVIDPHTQRSLSSLEELIIPPASEVLLHSEARSRARESLEAAAEKERYPSTQLRPLLDDLDSGMLSSQLELFPALFAGKYETLESLTPKDALWVVIDPEEGTRKRVEFIENLAMTRRVGLERGRLCLPVELRARAGNETEWPGVSRIECPKLILGEPRFPVVRLQARSNTALVDRMVRARAEGGGMGAFVEQALLWQGNGARVCVVSRGKSGQERLRSLLSHHRVVHCVHEEPFRAHSIVSDGDEVAGVQLYVGELAGGFQLDDPPLVVVEETEIFGKRQRGRRGQKKATTKEELFGSFEELEIGGYVVHVDHGVARYDGLVRLTIDGVIGDFLDLHFKEENRLYLPVYRMNRVQRYVGADNVTPVLAKLGGTSWERTQAKVRADLLELAKHLVETEAKRQARYTQACSPPDEDFQAFEAAFPYEPTVDQEEAINDVLDDLQKVKPMDRLVCGDVGFGKTEVAIRAAYKIVQEGRQVAILVPTTILAEQHLETFRARMGDHAVEVAGLSRFRTRGETERTMEGLATGRVDIVVGTHRLLQSDVRFRRLGLVVIDEEHRFGVRHKERLKELKESVHVLTLTATPIPRTLHFALVGLRELSMISTPPRDRLAVQTVVERVGDGVVEEAIRRELNRGGQVFYIHNRVQTIETCAERLQALVPEARIAVGHGQMAETRLARVMRSFIRGDSNVLVSTTIVENGLDIPNANTLIVERSDRFGLADLYQLRGRVGRSHVRAYAYFLIPAVGKLSADSSARLQALQRLTTLGSGIQIAQRDLEIRGAGNILGKQQSGQINAIGYELYAELLEEALARLHGEERELDVDTELQVSLPAYVSEEYCPEARQRLSFYKKLATAKSLAEVEDCFEEMVDRCGRPSDELLNLVALARIRLRGKALRIQRIEFAQKAAAFSFHEKAVIDPLKLIPFLGCTPGGWRLSPDGQTLIRPLQAEEYRRGVEVLQNLLEVLCSGFDLEMPTT